MLKKIRKNWILVRFFLTLSIFTLITGGSVASPHAAAIASAHELATKAGETVLAQGGNAFDAAVAVSAALAVVEPYASGIGGGGFWLLHRASDSHDVMIDGRETAPGKASNSMYLDARNKPIPGASLNGPLAAAIPGTPAALDHIAKKYGKLPLAQSLAPAIKLARDGFKLDSRFANTLNNHQEKLSRYADTAQTFLDVRGDAPAQGTLLRQPKLAATLLAIGNKGRDGFYRGWVAQEMIRSVQQSGGIWQHEDLVNYRVIERQPVKFTYRGAQVTTASLPSSGGLTMGQGLNLLENFALSELQEWDQVHVITEALRYAYQDRMRYLGDSDFVKVPEAKLLSKVYARERATNISMKQVTPMLPQTAEANNREGTQTTHFSIIDKEGNRVAATMSVNTFFGSGFVAGKSGVLLNNEMDDFSISHDVPNVFGLYGMQANYIAPGKRPLSSMSPTFVEDDKGVLILGTPGGSRIISMVLLAIIDYVDNQQTNPVKLVSNPRFHHQYLPDQLIIEPDAFNDRWIAELKSKGHSIQVGKRVWGNMQLIYYDKNTRRPHVANDPRGLTATRY
ncbi:MAG: gamma-glutamyltransferase [Nitrosomonas sp.]|nr:gamma-glutamyltransferase [Nitrosomonas sp.]